jgi:hypothetical protein
MSTDIYYSSILVRRYNPKKWKGDAYQKNAKLDELYDRINSLNPSLVIDAGCGRNSHKSQIKNLIGFDASPFPEVDICCPISEAPFEPESADAVLCLGSVQFIGRNYIIENMDKIISWVKPGGLIEMRVMLADSIAIDFWKYDDPNGVKFPWDESLRAEIANKHKLEYMVAPWVYHGDLDDEKLEAIKETRKQSGYRINEEKIRLRAKQSRECWTWRKPL